MNNSFRVFFRQHRLGRRQTLQDAILLAKKWAGKKWIDAAVYQGNELVAVVQAGGLVLLFEGSGWADAGSDPALRN